MFLSGKQTFCPTRPHTPLASRLRLPCHTSVRPFLIQRFCGDPPVSTFSRAERRPVSLNPPPQS